MRGRALSSVAIVAFAAALAKAQEFNGMDFSKFEFNPGGACDAACPAGQTAVPKSKDFRPWTNGCSVPPFLKIEDIPDFTECCNKHDACYMACGVKKGDCEESFILCMQRHCKKEFEGSEQDRQHCLSSAETFHFGVTTFGCTPFKQSQEEACRCVPDGEVYPAVLEYTDAFLRVYAPDKIEADPDAAENAVNSKKYKGDYGKMLYALYRIYTDSIEVRMDEKNEL